MPMPTYIRGSWYIPLLLLLILPEYSMAHVHSDIEIPGGGGATSEPLSSTLRLHIFCMSVAFGILFPTGLVLGLTRSRFHVPVQLTASLLVFAGYILAHIPATGRQFADNAHRWFAYIVLIPLIGQVAVGSYLKLHTNDPLRRFGVLAHAIIGPLIVVLGYSQMVLGVITSLGWCRGIETGQCLAHFIMGSSFVGYGFIVILMLRIGADWLRRRGRSQEWYDSWVILSWGAVNSLTEHRWGEAWSHGDMQHTSMGIMWFCAGALGAFLARGNRRNVVPSLVILFTGVAMVGHSQHNEAAAHMHTFFGYCLGAAAITRIIEICFIWKEDDDTIKPFHHLPPFLLTLAGFTFMGATVDQLAYLVNNGIDLASYINILISLAFLVYLYGNGLITLWQKSGKNASASKSGYTTLPMEGTMEGGQIEEEDIFEDSENSSQGSTVIEGMKRKEVEQFELESV